MTKNIIMILSTYINTNIIFIIDLIITNIIFIIIMLFIIFLVCKSKVILTAKSRNFGIGNICI